MNDIHFRIENRHLLKMGWQECISGALASQGVLPEQIPQGAKLLHRPIPNKAQTVFCIYVPKEGAQDPFMQSGKVRDFWEFMTPAAEIDVEKAVQAVQREAVIQQHIREQEAKRGVIIH